VEPADSADQNIRHPLAGFGEISVELDAIEPGRLRRLVQNAIERHLPAEQYEKLIAAEESERAMLTAWARDAVSDL
jgi:hypothetical protein